jgi:hypothetical protein
LNNLPLKSFDANRIWCAVVALACEVTAWMGMLALVGHQARRWEPKTLRFRLFAIPATLARSGRRVRLHLVSRVVDSFRSGLAANLSHGLRGSSLGIA